MSENKSLQSSCGFRIDVYLLWMASTGALIAGLYFPVITFTQMIFNKSSYSIIAGVGDLCLNKDYVLAAVIFIFSVIFPVTKMVSLLILWFVPINKTGRTTAMSLLGNLGRWSMLDVYVVAMTIVIAKSSLLKAVPEKGIYFFGASVILALLTSARIERLSKKAA